MTGQGALRPGGVSAKFGCFSSFFIFIILANPEFTFLA